MAELSERALTPALEQAPAILSGRPGETATRISWGEVHRRANRLAHRLRRLGAGEDTLVAVLMERSPALLWTLLGVIKADAAYLPLDPTYPVGRLRAMLRDAGAIALLEDGSGPVDLDLPDLPTLRLSRTMGEEHTGFLAGEPDDPPPRRSTGASLAYVMFTSGSTGRPKGVAVVHRAIARLVCGANYVHLGPEDRIAQVSNSSFDAATFEYWGALLSAATLVHVPTDILLSPRLLGRLLAERGVTTLSLTMGPFHQAAEEAPEIFADLGYLFFGAEAADPRRVRRVRAAMDAGAKGRLVHLYGPTESTSFASFHDIERLPEATRQLHIGRPLTNTGVHLLGPALRPAALGAPGEIFLAGQGLARGYWRRPARTAERFVPDPWTTGPGGRLYRTGDLARHLARGEIQFLGRFDQQVKVRGFRIEPGEVEAALEEHDAVARAVVLPVDNPETGQPHLVAWLLQNEGALLEGEGGAPGEPDGEDWQGDQVEQWRLLFDDAYDGEAPEDTDPTFHIAGWNRTADGTPIPSEEMRAWLDDTVLGLLAEAPRRLLEIGCGTGLVLFRVAPHTELYLGTDISKRGLEHIESLRSTVSGGLPQVRLEERSAHDFTGFDAGSFDTVVLNSVVQYFPSAEYLAEVVEGACRVLAPGGRLFLGDLRSRPLLEMFRAEVALEQATGGATAAALRRRTRSALLEEDELLLDPEYFTALAARLPRPTTVEIRPKRGPFVNELTRYRYQVVLRLDRRPPVQATRTLDWQRADLSLPALRHLLTEEVPEHLVLTDIPNARLDRPRALLEALRDPEAPATAAALDYHLKSLPRRGVDPEDLWQLAEDLPYDVDLRWHHQHPDGALEAHLHHHDTPPPNVAESHVSGGTPAEVGLDHIDLERALSTWATNPLRGRFARRIVPELRRDLGQRLPEHMVPQRFVVLDELPLTANGKLDRAALADLDLDPIGTDDGSTASTPPRTPHEEIVAGIWAEVLDRERIGAHDDFFDLGGHSLLATQAASRLGDAFGMEVPLRTLFEHTTVAALAAAIESRRLAADSATAPPAMRRLNRSRQRDFPVSFSQLREWILESLQPGSTVYHITAPLRLLGPLHLDHFETTFRLLVTRHETLRTGIVPGKDEPRQVIHPPPANVLRQIDLSGLNAAARQRAVEDLMRQEQSTPFDLGGRSLLRTVVVRLAEEEHLWILTLHHIISDGWSWGLFNSEIDRLYRALSAGRPARELAAELGELPLQYADFAAWQRQWLQGAALERLTAWWRRQLADSPPLLSLPLDRPRPAVRSSAAGLSYLPLPESLVGPAEQFARRQRASLYMVLLTGLKILLYRWTGQRDLAIGTFIANRNRTETSEIIGFFTNTLVMRTRLEPHRGAAPNLRRVKETALAAYAHQDLPFEKLLDTLDVERNPSHSPLFQVLMSLHNLPVSKPQLGDLDVRYMAVGEHQADFDLEITLYPVGEKLQGEVKYSSSLFDATTIVRLLTSWRRLLEHLFEGPETPLRDLPLLAAAEAHQLLVEANDRSRKSMRNGLLAPHDPGPSARNPGPTHPHSKTGPRNPSLRLGFSAGLLAAGIHGALARQTASTPELPAIHTASGAGLTYEQLSRRIHRLARRLRRRGVVAETVVGFAVGPGPEMVVALFAILEAGGAYLPLDLDQPEGRLTFLLRDAGARWLLGRRDDLDRLRGPASGAAVEPLILEEEIAHGDRESPEPLALPCHGEQLAYVIYTSGTSGEPKGVQIPHRALLEFLPQAEKAYGLRPGDRILQFAALTFDTSAEEIFPTLASGATLVFGEGRRLQTPADFTRRVRELQLTVLDLPTAYWHELLADPAFDLPATLRLVILGGEKARANAVEAWRRRMPPAVHLLNTYGPSEATIVAIASTLAGPRGAARGADQSPPIGRPLPGRRVVLVDRHLHATPRGAHGEVALGGAGLARGYLGRPRLTAAAFVPAADPGAAPGSRLYLTGDRVRMRFDGQLEFLGRIDHQVKLRGLRVEPEEVASVLGRHGLVDEAAVLARPLASGQLGLVAYVASRGPVETAQLRRHLQGLLPAYMVPGVFVLLDALPKTSSHKIDRRALLRVPLPTSAERAEATAPRSAREQQLAKIWAQVLGLERVGVDESFFDLGGDSLLILRLHRRLEEELRQELKVLDLFRHTNVRALATHLGSGQKKPELDRARELVQQQRKVRTRRRRAPRRRR